MLVNIHIVCAWVMTPCILVGEYQYMAGTYIASAFGLETRPPLLCNQSVSKTG
jgi:hypothetical protein